MKKILLLLSWVFVLNSANAQKIDLKFKSIEEFQKFFQWSPGRYPLISAHRGGPAVGFPENAIETFANTYQQHPAIIECDIALSKDSVLLMMHDDKLDRTSNGTGPIGQKNYDELKSLRLKDNDGKVTDFAIPTLGEVLKWGRNKVIYTLDVKRGVPYSKVVQLVRLNKAEAYSVIITYSATQAAEVHKLAPDLMISASVRSIADLERLNQMGVPSNRIVAFVGTSSPEKAVYDALHQKGIWCILGTMGNLDRSAKAQGDELYQKLVKDGADILSSDRANESAAQLLKLAKDSNLKIGK